MKKLVAFLTLFITSLGIANAEATDYEIPHYRARRIKEFLTNIWMKALVNFGETTNTKS